MNASKIVLDIQARVALELAIGLITEACWRCR